MAAIHMVRATHWDLTRGGERPPGRGSEMACLGFLALMIATLWTYAWADAAWSASLSTTLPPAPVNGVAAVAGLGGPADGFPSPHAPDPFGAAGPWQAAPATNLSDR